MFRSLAALAATVALASAAQANIPVRPLHAGVGTKADRSAPEESRQKIIDQLKADYEKVRERLNAEDPGDETRSDQKRILKGLEDLIKQRDPNQSKGLPSRSPPPRGSNEPNPDPKPAAGNPNRMLTPKQAKQQQSETKPQSSSQKPAGGDDFNPGNTPDDVRKETKTDGGWGGLPSRHRAALDAAGRERFVPNYQEILREYYRNIAQSSRVNNP